MNLTIVAIIIIVLLIIAIQIGQQLCQLILGKRVSEETRTL